MFKELVDFVEENDIHLQPSIILTDFEKAAINATRINFQMSLIRDVFYKMAGVDTKIW